MQASKSTTGSCHFRDVFSNAAISLQHTPSSPRSPQGVLSCHHSPALTAVKAFSVFLCNLGRVPSWKQQKDWQRHVTDTTPSYCEGIKWKSTPVIELGFKNMGTMSFAKQSNCEVHKEVYQNLHENPVETAWIPERVCNVRERKGKSNWLAKI